MNFDYSLSVLDRFGFVEDNNRNVAFLKMVDTENDGSKFLSLRAFFNHPLTLNKCISACFLNKKVLVRR